MIFIFYIFRASGSVGNMKEMFPALKCFYYIMEACECWFRHCGVALSPNLPIRCSKSSKKVPRKCIFLFGFAHKLHKWQLLCWVCCFAAPVCMFLLFSLFTHTQVGSTVVHMGAVKQIMSTTSENPFLSLTWKDTIQFNLSIFVKLPTLATM